MKTNAKCRGGRYSAGCRCELCRARAAERARRSRERMRDSRDRAQFSHGTCGGYVNWGCRCQACSQAHSRAMAEDRERRRGRVAEAPHGTRSGYKSWGCHCDACRTAAGAGRRPRTRRETPWTYKRVQDETADHAHRRGYQWTGPELELASRDDLTSSEVARMLGRTYSAVKNKRAALKRDPRATDLAGIDRPRPGAARIGDEINEALGAQP